MNSEDRNPTFYYKGSFGPFGKEFNFSYRNKDTLLVTIDPGYSNLIELESLNKNPGFV